MCRYESFYGNDFSLATMSLRISIGMPTFNRLPHLKEAVEGVLKQTAKHFEFVVVSDGSSDGTDEWMETVNDPRLRYIALPRSGPPAPLNRILEETTGEYLIILHDHDIFHPTLVERLAQVLDDYPSAGFAMPGSTTVGLDGKSNPRRVIHEEIGIYNKGRPYFDAFLKQKTFSSIFHACSMVRRSIFDQVAGRYEASYGIFGDVDIWLRLLRDHGFCYLQDDLIHFRERDSGHFLVGRQAYVLGVLYRISRDNASLAFSSTQLSHTERELLVKYRANLIESAQATFVRMRWKESMQCMQAWWKT